jgi:single-strand DNA-binding protein
MNKVQLVGRLTADPTVRYTNGGLSVARFNVACDRRAKKDGNQQTADFISCVAFGKSGEFVEKYFKKGNRIGITGRIQTGSYDKDGTKVYTTDIVCEEIEFVESKGSGSGASSPKPEPQPDANGFVAIPDGVIDEELPFD